MKKTVIFVLVAIFMFTAFSAYAKSEMTEEEAIISIEKSLEDPEIKAYVNKKYGSATSFFTAVKLASEETIFEVESTFTDFQEHGGDLTFKDNEIKFILIGVGFVVLLAILI